MKYISPEARIINFEAESIILVSDSLPDTPELLRLIEEEEKKRNADVLPNFFK